MPYHQNQPPSRLPPLNLNDKPSTALFHPLPARATVVSWIRHHKQAATNIKPRLSPSTPTIRQMPDWQTIRSLPSRRAITRLSLQFPECTLNLYRAMRGDIKVQQGPDKQQRVCGHGRQRMQVKFIKATKGKQPREGEN